VGNMGTMFSMYCSYQPGLRQSHRLSSLSNAGRTIDVNLPATSTGEIHGTCISAHTGKSILQLMGGSCVSGVGNC